MTAPVYVVLAAGNATRMGFDKVVAPLAEGSPLEAIVRALAEREAVVVVPPRLEQAAAKIAPRATIVINDAPERGMSHSLRLGLRAVARERDFGVLLGDMPAVTSDTIERTEELLRPGIDVAYPIGIDGKPGHPVLFSAGMRDRIDALPDGDTLRDARDAAARRATWVCTDGSAFVDLDEPHQWTAFRNVTGTS